MIVAEYPRRLAGFVWLGPMESVPGEPVPGEPVPGVSAPDSAGTGRGGIGELHYLFVDPLLTRRGIGTALLRAGEQRLRRLGYVATVLWVFMANTPARACYQRAGWTMLGDQRPEPGLAGRGHLTYEGQYVRMLAGRRSGGPG